MDSTELAAPLRITYEPPEQQQRHKEFHTPLEHQFTNAQNIMCG